MKLRDLLKVVNENGQDVIVRLMYPTDNGKLDHDTDFNFVYSRDGSKLDPTFYHIENNYIIGNKEERQKLTEVLNILLKMNVKRFYSDIDYGKTEWDDYVPIGDYDIRDRIIIELQPITSDDFAKLLPKKYLFRCAHCGYVTNFTIYNNVKTVQVQTKE